MGIQDFQEVVLKNGGYILSDGTLNYQHLLPKAYDLLVFYEINDKKAEQIKKDIIDVFEIKSESFGGEQSLFVEQYWGDAEIKDDKFDDANWIWNEDLYDYLNGISPTNYYYGSNEDGACIGWFRDYTCSNCGSEFCDDLDDDNICGECRGVEEE